MGISARLIKKTVHGSAEPSRQQVVLENLHLTASYRRSGLLSVVGGPRQTYVPYSVNSGYGSMGAILCSLGMTAVVSRERNSDIPPLVFKCLHV